MREAMPEQSADWLRQAESDLRHAYHAVDDADYDWASFAAQQAAEKALKALCLTLHLDSAGHAVSQLLSGLPEGATPPTSLLDRAKQLDKHYISTRYPGSFERGAPVDYYTRPEADRAIEDAEAILEFCRDRLNP